MLQHDPIAVRRKAYARCCESCWISIETKDAQSRMSVKNCRGVASPAQGRVEDKAVRDAGKKFGDLADHHGVMRESCRLS